jgi:hypothetical protein
LTTQATAPRRYALSLALLGLLLGSRLGFLGNGLGTDPDAHRLALAARTIRATGHYVFSREPGHPVQECLAALLVPLGSRGLNGATALMSVLAVASFAWVAKALGLRRSPWLAVGFAFTPLFWIHSVDSMDFVWAMAFSWLGLGLALRGYVLWAGVALGLAIGCRLTEGLALIPAILLCGGGAVTNRKDGVAPFGRRHRGCSGRLVFVTLAVGALCYLPVARVYGARALRVYETGRVPWPIVLHRWWIELWGVPGVIGLFTAVVVGAILAVAATFKPKLSGAEGDTPGDRRSLLRPEGRRIALAVVLPVLGYWILFLRLPHDAGYLLATIPYVLLFVGIALPPISTHVVVIALLLSNVPVGPWQANTVWGAHERRRSQVRTVRRWIAQLRRETEPLVLVAGTYQPKILSELGGERLQDVEIRYLLRADEAQRLKIEGKRIVFLKRVLLQNREVMGLDLQTIDARPFGE